MLDEDFAELLLEPLPLVEDDDEGTLLEEAIFTLLLDLDEISSSFELLAEIDESLPQAVKNRANKKMNKVFFITVNITHFRVLGQSPRQKGSGRLAMGPIPYRSAPGSRVTEGQGCSDLWTLGL